jgi:hypothetical protein
MSVPYAPQIKIVHLLERNKAQNTDLKVFRANAQVVPTLAKYTLLSPTGKKLVNNQSATIDSNGTMTYTLLASHIPESIVLGEGYVEEWSVTIESVVHVFRRMISVVLRKLYPVISDEDLTAIYSDLHELLPSSLTSYQKYIDDAWYQILRKVRQGAGYEYLVMSPESFYEAHRHLSLYLIFRDFHSSLGQSTGRYLDLANEHKSQFDYEWKSTSWIYDSNHDTKADEPNKRTSQQPVIYTTGKSHYLYNRYSRFNRF